MIYRGLRGGSAHFLCRIYSLNGLPGSPPSGLFLSWSAVSACPAPSSSKGQSRSRWQHATGQTQWPEEAAAGESGLQAPGAGLADVGSPEAPPGFYWGTSLLQRTIQPLVENRNVAESLGHGAGDGSQSTKRAQK